MCCKPDASGNVWRIPSVSYTHLHLLADFVPGVYDGDTLGAELAKQLQGNEKILILSLIHI